MPLILSAPDALPYIDAPQSDEALTAAAKLVEQELESTSILHSSIPPLRPSTFSDLVQAQFDRIEAGKPKEAGIDLSRYDVLTAPEKNDLDAWRATLQRAYASSEYLRGRELNLALLETYGKNAWLIGNSQLEDILRDIETELDSSKTQLQNIEEQRRQTQAYAAGEMQSLNDTWRQGIGRLIETQAAAERLKQDILERRRGAAT